MMKPPIFDYVRPDGIEHALALLQEHGDEAKPVAGGQSLIPLLNLRLARPALIVDVNDIPENRVETLDAALVTGALVRHRTLCLEPSVSNANPLLAAAARFIGHTAIRNRGTVGGSLAHADPAAELPLVAVACDATLTARSARGSREIPASQFFVGPFMTSLEPDELLVSVRWPTFSAGDSWGFSEIAERAGDFAMAAAAVYLKDRPGTPPVARVAVSGIPGSPLRLAAAEEVLSSPAPTLDELRMVTRDALTAVVQNSGEDSSLAYRCRLAEEMVVRAGRQALEGRSAV